MLLMGLKKNCGVKFCVIQTGKKMFYYNAYNKLKGKMLKKRKI